MSKTSHPQKATLFLLHFLLVTLHHRPFSPWNPARLRSLLLPHSVVGGVKCPERENKLFSITLSIRLTKCQGEVLTLWWIEPKADKPPFQFVRNKWTGAEGWLLYLCFQAGSPSNSYFQDRLNQQSSFAPMDGKPSLARLLMSKLMA